MTCKPIFPFSVAVVLSFFSFLFPICSQAYSTPIERGYNPKDVIDSLNLQLKNSVTAVDSLNVLVDLFDVTPRAERTALGDLSVDLSLRTKNQQVGLDMLRNLANLNYASDSMLSVYSDIAMKFPESDNRDETLLFIDMFHNFNHVENANEKDRMRHLDELTERMANNPPENIYDKVRVLHAICVHIIDLPDVSLLSKYINALDSAINTLRPKAYALRNMFLVQASMAYNRSVFTSGKGIEYDRRMLAGIDSLEAGRRGFKRKFRNYAPNRYIIYSRMLSNYDSLSLAEAETLYDAAMKIVAEDSLVANTNKQSMRPQIYMAMKHKDYDEAYPLLVEAVDMPYNSNVRPRMLKMLLECALAKNDNETVAWALNEYISILEQNMEVGTVNKWRELEIMYDMKRIKDAFDSKQSAMRSMIKTWGAAAALMLMLLLIVVGVLLQRSRRLAKNLAASNGRLKMELDNLQQAKGELAKARDQAQLANRLKNAFIKNITDEVRIPLQTISEYVNLIVDNEDLKKRPYMQRYADMVEMNSDMVSMLVNDLAILVEIDSGAIKPVPQKQTLKSLCEMAVSSVRTRVKPGVELKIIDNDAGNVMLYTDTRRLLHIIWQLLSNATKFTQKGSITVEYGLMPDGRHVKIAIEDTGIGVAKENAEKIFERFVKLDSTVPGAGIGLPLARLLVKLLGGTLVFVPRHAKGARFEIEIPISL